jgi:hypothetical protein
MEFTLNIMSKFFLWVVVALVAVFSFYQFTEISTIKDRVVAQQTEIQEMQGKLSQTEALTAAVRIMMENNKQAVEAMRAKVEKQEASGRPGDNPLNALMNMFGMGAHHTTPQSSTVTTPPDNLQ